MQGFLLSFILVLAPLKLAFAGEYSLADLAALSKENAHEEFFEHALDIKPSERLDAWQDMVLKMGLVFTQSVLNKSEIKPEEFAKTERIYAWQALKKDATFRDRRNTIGLRYLKSCLGNENPCWTEFKAFWEADQRDADVAIKLAELMLDKPLSPIPLWTLLEKPLRSPLSEFYCQKEFVMNSLWGKLEIDFIRVNTGGDFGKKVGDTIHADCLPFLVKEANRRLLRPDGSNDRELSFMILKSQGKVDRATEDFFYVMYLLGKDSLREVS